jgi:hypothetical protein
MTRPRPSPDRRARSGLRLVPDLEPRPRACDDETLVLPGRIYVIPVWEISGKTGMINLYEADPATGKHLTGRDGSLTLVGQVPSAQLARADARPRLVWDYVGQTIRELAVREAEHEEDKCWADIKADRITLVEQGLWNKQTRDGKEIAAIAKIKPRFNKEYNEHNPGRIPIWRQVELRHLRDDALHRERWLPLEQRSVAAQAAAARAIVGARRRAQVAVEPPRRRPGLAAPGGHRAAAVAGADHTGRRWPDQLAGLAQRARLARRRDRGGCAAGDPARWPA